LKRAPPCSAFAYGHREKIKKREGVGLELHDLSFPQEVMSPSKDWIVISSSFLVKVDIAPDIAGNPR